MAGDGGLCTFKASLPLIVQGQIPIDWDPAPKTKQKHINKNGINWDIHYFFLQLTWSLCPLHIVVCPDNIGRKPVCTQLHSTPALSCSSSEFLPQLLTSWKSLCNSKHIVLLQSTEKLFLNYIRITNLFI